VVAELIRAGHAVVVYDNLSRGHRQAVHRDAQLVVADLSDTGTFGRVLAEQKIEAVMHFAASIEAGESMKVPEQFFRNNTANTLGILEAMLHGGVRKFVFSSTAALYGEPKTTPIRETDELHPTNAYGESKFLVERMLDWFNRIHGLRYASLRYFNAAGATPELGEAHNPESHLIPLVLQVAAGKRSSISIFGTDYPTVDGSCVRDYIHVLDLAQAHLLALEALQTRDKLVYNIGNGSGFSVRQIVEAARRISGHPIPVVESPRRPGDPAVLVASSEKIRNELRWVPKYPDPETIIDSAWQWHRRNPNGYSE
jgi:UDP-glucose 4-epimerase